MHVQALQVSRLKTLAARLGLCAAALGGSLGLATHASAAIVTVNTPIVLPADGIGLYINLVTGARSTSPIAGFDINPYLGSGGLLFYFGGDAGSLNGGVATTTTGPYLDLPVGSVVSAASTFSASANGANNETAAFRLSGTHRLGVRFTNEGTGATNYGYITMTTTGATGFPATITGWSYENTGLAITVAAVPEASTTLMMSFGALALGGLALRRQRRTQAA